MVVPLTIHRKDLECEDERRARAAQQGSGDTDGRKVPAAGAPVGIILAQNFQKKRELWSVAEFIACSDQTTNLGTWDGRRREMRIE